MGGIGKGFIGRVLALRAAAEAATSANGGQTSTTRCAAPVPAPAKAAMPPALPRCRAVAAKPAYQAT